jgi:hypothetical protein
MARERATTQDAIVSRVVHRWRGARRDEAPNLGDERSRRGVGPRPMFTGETSKDP